MKSWKRITLTILVLIGSTTFFGYWSFNQFNQAFDNLTAPYLANTYSVYPSYNQRVEIASTTLEMSEEVSTSTDLQLSSTTPEVFTASTTSTDPELFFTFPKKDTKVYIGCTYQISWQPTTTINLLETALIDSGTREAMGPIAGGLAKESVIEENLQNLKWKVGSVWPGMYYIKVWKINGLEAEFSSNAFEIIKMPANISTEEQENVCKESGGKLL